MVNQNPFITHKGNIDTLRDFAERHKLTIPCITSRMQRYPNLKPEPIAQLKAKKYYLRSQLEHWHNKFNSQGQPLERFP